MPIPEMVAPEEPEPTTAPPTGQLRGDGGGPNWTDKTVAFFTCLLFVTAVIQGFIFYEQWREMHAGGTDTHDLALAAKAQADEAKAQVNKLEESLKKTDALISEAKVQANASREEADETNKLAIQATRSANYAQQAIKTAVDAERPWVGVNFYSVEPFVEGKPAKISIRFTNSGKRPATASIYYGVREYVSLPVEPLPELNVSSSVAFLLPGATSDAQMDFNVPDGMFVRLKREKKIFFVLAEIVYKDVGTNDAYITHFCAYYDPSNKNIKFPLCTRYNEAK